MKIENIKERLADLACRNFNQMSINYKSNLFEYDIDAFQLLYFAMDIEKNFDVCIEKIFDKTNYTFLTIDNLSEKIYELNGVKLELEVKKLGFEE